MAKVLMAIKPQYATLILCGDKTFEYRKTRIKRTRIDTIVLYVTSPVMKVLGEVTFTHILEGSPADIWKQTSETGGIEKEAFDQYFAGSKKAYAYALGKATHYEKAKTLGELGIAFYPQSYVYLDESD